MGFSLPEPWKVDSPFLFGRRRGSGAQLRVPVSKGTRISALPLKFHQGVITWADKLINVKMMWLLGLEAAERIDLSY